MDWTTQRVEVLKGLWNNGYTARQIAEKLGDGATRNAVIGKAHRLGLSTRPSPVKREKEPVPMINERTCQWPIGHPGQADFHFCGSTAETGRPYCSEHCAVAYRRSDNNAA